MKERLIQLLDLEQLSPSKFADIIGVQRSSISHVISGRNKPSFDFLQKTLKAFPGLNASWLMLGEGTMYEQMGRKIPGSLFEATGEGNLEELTTEEIVTAGDETETGSTGAEAGADYERDEGEVSEPSEETKRVENTALHGAEASYSSKRIVQVMVLYADDTFRTFAPAQ
jgi:transcriptional regulator with XRE-family HTH domain